jgi:hypothetical protein
MTGFQKIWELLLEALSVFAHKFMETIPVILGGVIVILIAWLLARLVSTGFERLLKTVKFDSFAEKFNITKFLKQANITMSPSAIIGRVIYWVFVLLIIASAAEALQWTLVSTKINAIVDYIPRILTSTGLFIIGAYIAAFVRDFVRGATSSMGISTGRIISSAIYYLLIIMIVLTSLQQAGLETGILSNNLLIIIGSVMLSGSISYALASKDVLANILAGFFNKRNFQKGMLIEVNGVKGMIIEMSNVSVTIQVSETERMVIPSHELLTNKVKIIK